MARYEDVPRETLDPEGQATFDMIAATRKTVRGPYAPLMHVPKLARRVAELGSYIRYEGLLAGSERELAICTMGRLAGSAFEWVAHAPIGIQAGTRPEALEIIRTGAPLDGLLPRERLIVEVVRALYHEHTLSEDLFQRARDELGQDHLLELVTLAGYYVMISYLLLTFDVPLPAGSAQPF